MYSIEDRSQVITIGGVEHKLILTTKATKDITKRYGGLEKLGDKHYGISYASGFQK